VVAGLDEAGRGPWAGPLVAAAVIFKPVAKFSLSNIDDSKKLSHQKRKKLLEKIKGQALSFGLGLVSAVEIDQIGLSAATHLAMLKALNKLSLSPRALLIDFLKWQEYPNGKKAAYYSKLFNSFGKLPHFSLVKGDQKSYSIAAASILAKEYRDQIMKKMDQIFPQYGFAQHKGYGTKSHRENLFRYGPCSIHRRSYQPVLNAVNIQEER
jgi:ribonuclease HII